MPDRKRVLIVCYSSSGNTRRVAKALAQQLDADVARLCVDSVLPPAKSGNAR